MMKKLNYIDDFYVNLATDVKDNKGRKLSEIVTETREVKGTKDGKSLIIANCKAIRLFIDDQIFTDKIFKDCFQVVMLLLTLKKHMSIRS
jgi:hypothetical protein